MMWIPKKLSPETINKISDRTVKLIAITKRDTIPEPQDCAVIMDQSATDLVQLACHIKYLEHVLRSYTGEKPVTLPEAADNEYYNVHQNSVANIEVLR